MWQINFMIETDQVTHTAAQKARAALEALGALRPLEAIAREHGVTPSELTQWKMTLVTRAASLFGTEQGARAPAAPAAVAVPAAVPAAAAPVAPPASAEQMQVNEALVFKVLELQQAEDALQRSKASLHELLGHHEQIREEERKRIAREIHDDLGQNLLALRIDVSMLHARTGPRQPRLHGRVGVVLENVDATIRSVRAIMNDLRPFELELGLLAAIEWQIRRFERSGIACRLTVAETACGYALDAARTLAVFRILQEALSNVARHSLATAAEITLARDEHNVVMTVSDNGIGFSPEERRQARAFGIAGMIERLGALGGTLVLERGAGAGAAGRSGMLLRISVPVGAAGAG
ncbi:MAG: histidine kinase [Pseudomonadota bacterium]